MSSRAERMAALARSRARRDALLPVPAFPTERYQVIYADPPWRFETRSPAGMQKSPEGHYPTLSDQEIAALPVARIACPSSVLLLWSTVPKLPSGLAVMAAWGFEYRTHFAWVKSAADRRHLRLGLGYWNRNAHELLLLGVRGRPSAPLPADKWPSVIVAKPGRHSEKPTAFLLLAERSFPQRTKIELFRRGRPRPGWACWGNETLPPSPVDNLWTTWG
jgi:N6-adenosine-specific RNA methylase IME4